MNAITHRTTKLARRLTVLAFGLWLAGMSCALCCPELVKANSHADASSAHRLPGARQSVSSSEHCPAHAPHNAPAQAQSAQTHHADLKTASPLGISTKSAPLWHEGRAASCCEKVRQPSAAPRKLRPVPEPTAIDATEKISLVATLVYLVPPMARERLPDGRATHVRCRVFLI